LAAPASACELLGQRSAHQIISQITNNKLTHKISALFRTVTICTCFQGVSSVALAVSRKSETRIKEKFRDNIKIGRQ